MAYSFDRINSLFGNQGQGDKVNIFGDQGGQQQQGMGQGQTGQQQQPQAQPKTTDSGDLGNSAAASATQGGEAKPQAAAPQGASQIVQKNQGKQQAPQSIQNIGTSLNEADTNLQNEANSYVQAAKTKDFGMKPEDLEGAIAEKTPGDKTTAVLGRLSQAAPTAEAFQPKTDVNVQDVNLLRPQTDATGRQSNVGLEQLLRRDYGPEYSGNQAKLDTNLLTRTPGFNLIRDQLVNRQDALTKQAKDDQTSKTQEAQDAETANFNTGTQGIKDYLGTQSQNLINTNKAQVDQENAARDALRQTLQSGGSVADLDSRSKEAMAKLNEDFKAGNPRALQFLKDSGVSPQDFYAVSGNLDREKDYGQFVDQGESDRFNRINELLGNKDALAAGTTSDRAGFNTAGYQKAVSDAALGKRATADQGLQAGIDKILSGDKSRADAINQHRAALTGNLLDESQKAIRGDYDTVSKNYDAATLANAKDQVQGLDPRQFYSVNQGQLSGESMISPEEAMQLQELNAQLGGQGVYKEGAGAGGEDSTYNSGGYRTALQGILDKSKSDLAAQAKAAAEHEQLNKLGLEKKNGMPTLGTTPTILPNDILPTIGEKLKKLEIPGIPGTHITQGAAPFTHPVETLKKDASTVNIKPSPIQAPKDFTLPGIGDRIKTAAASPAARSLPLPSLIPPSPVQLPSVAQSDFSKIKNLLGTPRFY